MLGMEASNVTNSAVYKWLENTESLMEAARLVKWMKDTVITQKIYKTYK